MKTDRNSGKFLVDLSALKLDKKLIERVDAAIQQAIISTLSEHAGLRASTGKGYIFLPPPDPGFPNGIVINVPNYAQLISIVDKNQ